MKKKVGTVLMVLGFLVIGLGIAWPYSSDSQMYCEQFHVKAIALLDDAIKAGEGTPEAAALMQEAESETAMADVSCESAAEFRQQAMMIGGGGLLLLVIGLLLRRGGKGATPAA